MFNCYIYGDLKVLYGKRYRLVSFLLVYKFYKCLISLNYYKLVLKLLFVYVCFMMFFMIDKVMK